ncbi:LysR family transcriptional regulator [Roseomonas populi]|uniref:LysR family transcriptional regulator n=1 Tax=Roseomonas populi TaxID=3121582 RepID=A0ABT1X8R7_9PROT|nr:LysR family transcriptional regulator [Roseomonas pecuniae]MCR0984500.1 LysR family transcriptional regulator [Roseomonas pecuniae]
MSQRSIETGLRKFDLNLLPVFWTLMKTRSVTRTGEALFLSQPATSAALARLRTAFKDDLFVRQGRTLEPTPKAEALMEQLGPLMQGVAGALGESIPFDPATDARTFRIGMSEDVAMAVMPALPAIRQAAPNCRLIIRAASYRTISDMFGTREISTAIGHVEELPASAKQRVLRRGGWVVLRDAASSGPVDLDEYCARPHLLVTPRGDLTGFADAILAGLGRQREVVLGLPDYALIPRAVLGTNMLCLVSEMVYEALSILDDNHRLAADPPPFPCEDSVTYIAWRSAVDHDPGEMWIRNQLIQALTRH